MLEFLEIFFLGQHTIFIDFCEADLSLEFLPLFKSVSICLLSLSILPLDDSIAGDVQLVHVLFQAIHPHLVTPLLLLCVEPSLPLEGALGYLSVDDFRPT